jgi:hypothetical protein
MAFRGRKLDALLGLEPDLAVVQECGRRDLESLAARGFHCVWEGRRADRGLGVLAPDLSISLDGCHDPELAYYVPLTVGAPGARFRLVAAWAYGHRSTTAKRWALDEALAHYEHFLCPGPAVVAGDLNNHPIWDTPSRPTFARSLQMLGRAGLRSAWHHTTGTEHGAERCGTFYFYRRPDRPYHIDYCFVSSDIEVRAAAIGAPATWLALSDHCPVVVDLELPPV